MKLQADAHLFERTGEIKFGAILFEGIETGTIPSMLVGRLQLYMEHLNTELQEKQWTDIRGIAAWRQHFKQTGADPSRYRPSVEALYRRAKKEATLPQGNSAIVINNFFSLQYESPLGIYDASAIVGDVTLRIGNSDDQYEGLNGRSNSLKNIIVTSDEKGPFGSPYVDSIRTCITDDTIRALQFVYFHSEITEEQAKKMLAAISKMFIQVHGGTSSQALLTKDQPYKDI